MAAAALARRNASWMKLWPEVLGEIRDGGRLKSVEAGWALEWLEEIGRVDLELEEVQFVQIPSRWAAEVVGSKSAASSAVNALEVAGVLRLVRRGERKGGNGHASLYCVMPLPEPNSLPP